MCHAQKDRHVFLSEDKITMTGPGLRQEKSSQHPPHIHTQYHHQGQNNHIYRLLFFKQSYDTAPNPKVGTCLSENNRYCTLVSTGNSKAETLIQGRIIDKRHFDPVNRKHILHTHPTRSFKDGRTKKHTKKLRLFIIELRGLDKKFIG